MTVSVEALSEREKETLRLLLKGHDAKSIARELGLSVHTVNERLRASRRKLEVSNSREAARLLASSEQPTPNFDVNKEIGVGGHAANVGQDRRRSHRKRLEHPALLAIGGTLIMSFVTAAAMLAWFLSEDAQPGGPPRWSTASTVPEGVALPRNIVRLDGNRLLWNETDLSEPDLRLYLDLTTRMDPQPMVVLSCSAETQPRHVQRVKSLIEDVVRCSPRNCLEITFPPA